MGNTAADGTSKCKARVEINSCRTRRCNAADSPDFRLRGGVDRERVDDIRLVEHFGADSIRKRSSLSCFYSGFPAAEMERDGEEVKVWFCAGGEITASKCGGNGSRLNHPPVGFVSPVPCPMF